MIFIKIRLKFRFREDRMLFLFFCCFCVEFLGKLRNPEQKTTLRKQLLLTTLKVSNLNSKDWNLFRRRYLKRRKSLKRRKNQWLKKRKLALRNKSMFFMNRLMLVRRQCVVRKESLLTIVKIKINTLKVWINFYYNFSTKKII